MIWNFRNSNITIIHQTHLFIYHSYFISIYMLWLEWEPWTKTESPYSTIKCLPVLEPVVAVSALILAYTKGNGNLCRSLVKAGACVGAMNKDGVTIFNYQVASNSKTLLKRYHVFYYIILLSDGSIPIVGNRIRIKSQCQCCILADKWQLYQTLLLCVDCRCDPFYTCNIKFWDRYIFPHVSCVVGAIPIYLPRSAYITYKYLIDSYLQLDNNIYFVTFHFTSATFSLI